jgi:3-dehydroquinate dehydratase II
VADDQMTRLWLLHGVNLDMLGSRDPAHYGTLTLAELEAFVAGQAAAQGFVCEAFQTNHEGELVEKLHEISRETSGAVIINPGAWTHYSYALHDALELVGVPVAEVHLSDVSSREDWRRASVIADVADVHVSGRGAEGYAEAVRELARLAGQEAQL